jgi:hypothetical protein
MAANWVQVASSDTSIIQIDMTTVKRISNERVYWAKRIYSQPTQLPSGRSFDSILSRGHVDCDSDTAYSTSITYYLGDQNIDYLERSNRQDIAPGTVLEAQEHAVCK